MADVRRQKKSCLRALWRAFEWLLLLVLVNAVIFGIVAWRHRIEWVTKIARKELDKRGLSDVAFGIETLLPDRVVLEGIRVGEGEEALLEVARLEARLSPCEILRGEIGRVRVWGVSLPVRYATIETIRQYKRSITAATRETLHNHNTKTEP
jgi:hypothetical protein